MWGSIFGVPYYRKLPCVLCVIVQLVCQQPGPVGAFRQEEERQAYLIVGYSFNQNSYHSFRNMNIGWSGGRVAGQTLNP